MNNKNYIKSALFTIILSFKATIQPINPTLPLIRDANGQIRNIAQNNHDNLSDLHFLISLIFTACTIKSIPTTKPTSIKTFFHN